MGVVSFDGKPLPIEGNREPGHTGGGGQPPMDERISHIETRLDSLEKNIATVQTDLSHIKTQIATLGSDVSNMRWWILGTCITIILSVGMIVIAFGQYQSSWFQLALNHNWEVAQKSLDKIEDTQLRLERMDALREAELLKNSKEQQTGKN